MLRILNAIAGYSKHRGGGGSRFFSLLDSLQSNDCKAEKKVRTFETVILVLFLHFFLEESMVRSLNDRNHDDDFWRRPIWLPRAPLFPASSLRSATYRNLRFASVRFL